MTHICVSKLTIFGSDNGLSPGRRQAIIWTNDGILLIRPLGTNFSEILSEIHTFSFKKMQLKTLSAKWRPFCLVFNVLIYRYLISTYPNCSVYIISRLALYLNQLFCTSPDVLLKLSEIILKPQILKFINTKQCDPFYAPKCKATLIINAL